VKQPIRDQRRGPARVGQRGSLSPSTVGRSPICVLWLAAAVGQLGDSSNTNVFDIWASSKFAGDSSSWKRRGRGRPGEEGEEGVYYCLFFYLGGPMRVVGVHQVRRAVR